MQTVKSKTAEKQAKIPLNGKTKNWPRSAKIVTLVLVIISLALGSISVHYLLAASATVTDLFDDESKIASKAGLAVSGGQVKLAEWTLGETGCNSIDGWHWYTTNGRSACWSKTLADSVSWNKGVGNDTRVTGTYTCAPLGTYSLQTRMQAAANGQWYKICSVINGHTMAVDGSEDGQAGATWISAVAISDCLDGTKDLIDCDKGMTCFNWTTTNSWLRDWAGTAGRSALPYLVTDAGTLQTDNDYWDACTQNSGHDVTIGDGTCTNNFYRNRKSCNDGDSNYSWVAAAGSNNGSRWNTAGRDFGNSSCSGQDGWFNTSSTGSNVSFRAVVRP